MEDPVKKIILITLIASLAVIAAGAAAAVFVASIPAVAQQVSPGEDYILVNLTHPLSGDALPLNTFTRVGVDALGVRPLTRLELWAGAYTLVARAYDADGHFALSNAVVVSADAAANRMLLT